MTVKQVAVDLVTETEPILSGEEIAKLNEARDILKEFGERCSKASWNTPTGYAMGTASAADYGRVHALTAIAEDAIFTVLNWTNSHRVLAIPDEQLHNRKREAA